MQFFIRAITFLSFLLLGQNYGIANENGQDREMEEGILISPSLNAEDNGDTDSTPLLLTLPERAVVSIPSHCPPRLKKIALCGAYWTSCICATATIFLVCLGAGFIGGGALDHSMYQTSHYTYYSNSANAFYTKGAVMMVGAVFTGCLALMFNSIGQES